MSENKIPKQNSFLEDVVASAKVGTGVFGVLAVLDACANVTQGLIDVAAKAAWNQIRKSGNNIPKPVSKELQKVDSSLEDYPLPAGFKLDASLIYEQIKNQKAIKK